MVITDPYKLAKEFTEYTHHSIFLTGKAGSGKTTLLKEIISTTNKNYVIVAPTGIAAINAGGTTIHSFFNLPTRTFLPTRNEVDYNIAYNIRDLLYHTHYRKEKLQIMRSLDLLIIDEISMCRADIMDAMDQVLRNVRRSNRPFGGVQLLMVGDLYQLPPVVKENESRLLGEFYDSPFFFSAQVFRDQLPLQIELDKIYRQTDEEYIRILNNIRSNEATPEDFESLNQRYQRMDQVPDEYIVLTTHNYKADSINTQKLKELPGEEKKYTAKIHGDFQEWNYPCEEVLRLKIGTRVMFVKNDVRPERKYFNGKIGTIRLLNADSILIDSDGEEIELERETWKNIRYTFNTEHDTIEEEELGAFHQFPLRLAWAITVHKSQGLTFQKAVLDISASFAAGQVYVALSRCTSLEGMILSNRIRANELRIDNGVIEFLERSRSNNIEGLLENEKTAYIQTYLQKIFDFQGISDLMDQTMDEFDKKPTEKKIEAVQEISGWQTIQDEIIETAIKFRIQVEGLFQRLNDNELYETLTDRTRKAITYFVQDKYEPLHNSVLEYYRVINRQKNSRKISEKIEDIADKIAGKMEQLKSTRIQNNLVYIDIREPQKKTEEKPEKVTTSKKEKPEKKSTYEITLEIFRECRDVESTAKQRDMAVSTIEGHLAKAIEAKSIEATELIPAERLTEICTSIRNIRAQKLSEIRELTGEKYSYSEIRYALSHLISTGE